MIHLRVPHRQGDKGSNIMNSKNRQQDKEEGDCQGYQSKTFVLACK